MNAVNKITQKINDEITPLVAFGLMVIACIIGFTALSRLSDATQSIKTQLDTAKLELATLQNLPEGELWDKRLAQSEAAKKGMLAQLWQGRTAGVIAADMEQGIRSTAKKFKIDSPVVRVDPEPIKVDDVEVMRFEVRVTVDDAVSAIGFLSDIGKEQRKIIIQNSNLSMSERGKSIARFDGYIPIQISAGADQ